MAACSRADITSIQLLLENGADHLLLDSEGRGALTYAAKSGNKAAVSMLLLKCGTETSEKYVVHFAAGSGNLELFDLVSQHFPMNETADSSGQCVIHYAAYGGNIEIIEHVLDAGNAAELLRKKNRQGESVLCCVIEKGNIEAIKVILERLSRLSPPLSFDEYALFAAIYCDSIEAVKLLYDTDREGFMKAKDEAYAGAGPLHRACYDGNAEIMEFLIDKGFNVLDVDRRNRSCLHLFAMTGHNDVARFFYDIDWQANFGMLTATGYTPLLLAAQWGTSKVFRRFLRNGASMLDQVYSNRILTRFKDKGSICLHLAASSGDSEVAEIIIGTHGKNCLKWTTFYGALAVHIAAGHHQYLFLEYLWEHGADLTAATPQGETPLFFAVAADSRLAVTFLLSKGVASFEQTLDSPILAYACVLEGSYILKSLLDQGLEITDEQRDGQNLLCLAAGYGSEEVISFLLTRGFDWASKGAHGWTARDSLECAAVSVQKVFDKERSTEPRSWLECSGLAFRNSQDSWFRKHESSYIAKIKGKSSIGIRSKQSR